LPETRAQGSAEILSLTALFRNDQSRHEIAESFSAPSLACF
jgi:hypothetical protein